MNTTLDNIIQLHSIFQLFLEHKNENGLICDKKFAFERRRTKPESIINSANVNWRSYFLCIGSLPYKKFWENYIDDYFTGKIGNPKD